MRGLLSLFILSGFFFISLVIIPMCVLITFCLIPVMTSKLYSFLSHVIVMGVPETLNKHDLFGLYSISFNSFIPLIHLANILKIIIKVFPFFKSCNEISNVRECR